MLKINIGTTRIIQYNILQSTIKDDTIYILWHVFVAHGVHC